MKRMKFAQFLLSVSPKPEGPRPKLSSNLQEREKKFIFRHYLGAQDLLNKGRGSDLPRGGNPIPVALEGKGESERITGGTPS